MRIREASASKKMITALIAALAAAFILEIFVFNFRMFETRGFDEITDYQLSVTGMEENEDGSYTITDESDAVITITGFEAKIKSVCFAAYLQDETGSYLNESISYQYRITDEANSVPKGLPELETLYTANRTWYTHLSLSGVSDTISISLTSLSAGDILEIDSLIINARYPFFFSPVRLAAVTAIIFFLLMLLPVFGLYDREWLHAKPCDRVFVIVLSLILFAAAEAVVNPDGTYAYEEETVTNRQYQLLAESLSEGEFSLNLPVSEALLSSENPYDPELRGVQEEDFYWDVAYYEGSYYVYFGVTPVLLFYLPYYLVTGESLHNTAVMSLLAPALIIGAFFLIHSLVKKYFKRTSVAVYALLGATVALGSGLIFLSKYTNIYKIPILCGVVLAVWALALWISALPDERGGKLLKTRLFLGSACAALVAGCRPQMLVILFIAVPLFGTRLICREEGKYRICVKDNIPDLAAFFIPLCAFGLFMMYYNFARFGSVLDFGANYNLTTNDMSLRGFALGRLPLGFYHFLLQGASFTFEYPFINGVEAVTGYQGITISESMYGGVLAVYPILWALFFYRFAGKGLKEKNLLSVYWITIISSVIIMAANTEMSGVLYRYVFDFVFLLLFAASFTVMALFETCTEGRAAVLLRGCFTAACILTIIFCLLLAFVQGYGNLYMYCREFYLKAAHLIMFWR